MSHVLATKLEKILRSLQEDHGFTMTDLRDACDTAISGVVDSQLIATEVDALRNPTGRGNGEILETLLLRGMVERGGMRASARSKFDYTISGSRASVKNTATTVYLQDLTTPKRIRKRLHMVPLKPISERAAGADCFVLKQMSRTGAHFDLFEFKMGTSEMSCGTTQQSANKSVTQLSKKIRARANTIATHLKTVLCNAYALDEDEAAEFTVEYTLVLFTTRSFTRTARDHLRTNNIKVRNAQYLYDNVWPDDVCETLRSIYGEDKAHTFKH